MGAGGRSRVLVIGAGVGGLAAAVSLAARGCEVMVVEKEPALGGKMRQLVVDGAAIDAGPTVLTMRWIFDELFETTGTRFEDHVMLKPASILARHAWSASERLDLFADLERSVEAIGDFAGAKEATAYRAFCRRAESMFETLDRPFIRSQRPRVDQLVASYGLFGLGKLTRISPFTTLWKALGEHFADPRLRQLFGRYATYCGSSPFLAPATLMLVAHVERVGVWYVDGGMHALARALAAHAAALGANFRYEVGVDRIETNGSRVTGTTLATGERIEADAIVCNADAQAIATGLFGTGAAKAVPALARNARSLSAITFAMRATACGFPLVRHNIFFGRDYSDEFDAIFARDRTPADPTVYICAQDRDDEGQASESERLLCLVNAPASGDGRAFPDEEIARCQNTMRQTLERCGLVLNGEAEAVTHPGGFAQLFPATGGALYGPSSHGWQASFNRMGARSKVPGLYLAGGSVHPGPGVPMAAMSGRLAAEAVLADLASTSRSRPTAMPGGTSMR